MSLPKFNAEAALGKPSRTYHGQYRYGAFGDGQTGASVLPNQFFDEEGTAVGEDMAALDDAPTIDLVGEADFAGDDLGELDPGAIAGLDEGATLLGEDVAALDDAPTIDLVGEADVTGSEVDALDDGLSG